MENFLNYCWLLLALAALSAWLGMAAPRRRTSLGLIALLCVLTLMFPVISATDDLHPVAQAIEDSSRRTQKALIAINQFVTHINYSIAALAPIVATPPVFLPSIARLFLSESASASQPGFRQPHFGRSPPLRIS